MTLNSRNGLICVIDYPSIHYQLIHGLPLMQVFWSVDVPKGPKQALLVGSQLLNLLMPDTKEHLDHSFPSEFIDHTWKVGFSSSTQWHMQLIWPVSSNIRSPAICRRVRPEHPSLKPRLYVQNMRSMKSCHIFKYFILWWTVSVQKPPLLTDTACSWGELGTVDHRFFLSALLSSKTSGRRAPHFKALSGTP